MTLDETRVSEHGAAAVEFIEFGNNDSKLKSGNHNSCQWNPTVYGTSTVLEFAAGSGHFRAVSDEDSKGNIVPSENPWPVACKSTCLLTVDGTGVSKCGKCREGNILISKNKGNTEQESVGDDRRTKCLQSTDGVNTENKDGSNLKMRLRNKSKYLSFPFIEPTKGEPSKGSDSLGDKSIKNFRSSSLVKCGRKRKQPKKSISDSANLDAVTATSAELILQLHIVACDHLKPYYNKSIDPAKLLFNSFRASVFRGLSIEEQLRTDKGNAQKKNKNQVKKEKDMTESDKKAPPNLNVAASSPLMADPLPSNVKPQRKRKRKEEEPITILESGAYQIAQIPDLNCVSGVEVKSEPAKKKRIRKKKTTLLNSISGISYPNGNSVKPISLEVCLQDARPYAFAASTVLDSNPVSPPGFCAKGSNPASPPGFCAKVLTPTKSTPPPKLEPVEKVNNVIGNKTNNKSNSGMTLDQMKQSLEFMTLMLEKSGDMISPLMRANLEKEIKNLLRKVDPMISSSS